MESFWEGFQIEVFNWAKFRQLRADRRAKIKEENISDSINAAFPILTRPRLPHEVLLAVGGWTGSPTNLIEAYDSRADEWVSVSATIDKFGQEKPRIVFKILNFWSSL